MNPDMVLAWIVDATLGFCLFFGVVVASCFLYHFIRVKGWHRWM